MCIGRCVSIVAPFRVVFETFGYKSTLRKYLDVLRQMLANERVQQRVVCATQYYCVDERILRHQFIDIFFDKKVGSGIVGLLVLNERDPHRTRLSVNGVLGIKFCNFGGV